jgi:predicted site-specific integrase-resolvase
MSVEPNSIDNIKEGFLPPEDAVRILKVSQNTLRKWEKDGRIQVMRAGGKGTHRRYNVKDFLRKQISGIPIEQKSVERKNIVYARVSTRNQSDNLKRQIELLHGKFPDYEVVSDIGSGINFKRKGLDYLLESAISGVLETVVVAYRDRLCRFGFELFERLFRRLSNAKIVVLDCRECSPNEELAEDILTVVTVFSARINGRKRYKRPTEEKTPSTHQENTGEQ